MAKPDYSYWDLQPEVDRIAAAFLCCDEEPAGDLTKGHPRFHQVLATLKRLDDDIPAIRTRGEFGATLFKKTYLRNWAERTGRREAAPWLFPEDRRKQAPTTRDNTLPNIVGAMLALFLDTDDKGNKLSVFASQNEIIAALLERYNHKPGISESNLKKQFAAAKQSLDQS